MHHGWIYYSIQWGQNQSLFARWALPEDFKFYFWALSSSELSKKFVSPPWVISECALWMCIYTVQPSWSCRLVPPTNCLENELLCKHPRESRADKGAWISSGYVAHAIPAAAVLLLAGDWQHSHGCSVLWGSPFLPSLPRGGGGITVGVRGASAAKSFCHFSQCTAGALWSAGRGVPAPICTPSKASPFKEWQDKGKWLQTRKE